MQGYCYFIIVAQKADMVAACQSLPGSWKSVYSVIPWVMYWETTVLGAETTLKRVKTLSLLFKESHVGLWIGLLGEVAGFAWQRSAVFHRMTRHAC